MLKEFEIELPDDEIYKAAKKRWDGISKPIDGLGDFEDLVCRLAAIQRRNIPAIEKRGLVVFCSDNGIVEEKISQSGKEVTLSVAKALGNGISSACSLAGKAKADVIPVDIGIDSEEEISGVRNLKVAKGTSNFLKEPAMTEEETSLAITRGIYLVKELSEEGYNVLLTGEMGIGNTTTSAAVLSAVLGLDSDEITGRGAGIDDEGLLRKKNVIKAAIEKYHFDEISDEQKRAFEILRTLGGFDIAGLAGMFIGGAVYHVPIVIDGVISSTAAVVAERLVPGVKEYMIASHRGREKGNEIALKSLGLTPYIEGNMALGEGTGALLLLPILDTVFDFYLNGAVFSDYSLEEYERFK